MVEFHYSWQKIGIVIIIYMENVIPCKFKMRFNLYNLQISSKGIQMYYIQLCIEYFPSFTIIETWCRKFPDVKIML